jgi:exopolyphosphatase/guanosine-5'-triphosphate,3'-diphosphate pyrophosphatase
MVKRSVIDIGSNTVKLFIAEIKENQEIEPLEIKRRMSRLGKGIHKTGYLDPESKELAIQHIEEYLKTCESYNIDHQNIMVTATAACRNATDGKDFINQLKEKYKLPHTKILSGREESEYTFLGTLEGITNDNNNYYYVLDIGGGSFQLSAGKKNHFVDGKSFQTGCNRVSEEFGLNRKISEYKLNRAIQYFAKFDLEDFSPETTPEYLAGAGGTLKIMHLMTRSKDDMSPIKFEELEYTAIKLASYSIEERFNWFKEKYPDEIFRKDAGLTESRAEVILAGIVIAMGILEKLNLKEILLSNTDAKNYIIKLSSF